MTKWSGEQRRKESFVRVKDEGSELVMILNTIFSGLILMVMGWVGFNINKITDRLGELTTASALARSDLTNIQREINRLEDDYERHKANRSAHHKSPYKRDN